MSGQGNIKYTVYLKIIYFSIYGNTLKIKKTHSWDRTTPVKSPNIEHPQNGHFHHKTLAE